MRYKYNGRRKSFIDTKKNNEYMSAVDILNELNLKDQEIGSLRALLKRYIDTVSDSEGTTFFSEVTKEDEVKLMKIWRAEGE